MQRPPRIGDQGEVCFVVASEHTIQVAGQQVPPVLSTPALIWFLEHAAIEALRPLLEDDETSVGVEVNVEHLAATPSGRSVRCVARVIHHDGPLVNFQVQAEDDVELIARGVHKRRVISAARFARYVNKKQSSG